MQCRSLGSLKFAFKEHSFFLHYHYLKNIIDVRSKPMHVCDTVCQKGGLCDGIVFKEQENGQLKVQKTRISSSVSLIPTVWVDQFEA